MAARVEIPIVVLNDQSPYNPVSGATCTITDRATGKESKVYSDSGTTNNELTQPLVTDSAGRLTGWLERGAYECTVTIPGRTPYSEPFDAASAKDGGIDTAWIGGEAVTGEKISSTIKDASAATPSLRTLGTSGTSAAAGNDARLSDERVPTNNSVNSSKLQSESVITEKIAKENVTDEKLASPNNGMFRLFMESGATFIVSATANTYILAGIGTAIPKAATEFEPGGEAIPSRYLVNADWNVAGKTTKMKTRTQLFTNNTAPGTNFTIGLYPVTAVTGGTNKMKITLGSVVSGSQATFTAPVAVSALAAESGEYTLPPAGIIYVLGVVLSGNLAANAVALLNAQVYIHNV